MEHRTKTFEEMANHTHYADGLEVEVNLPNVYRFKGKIVGLSSLGVIPTYVVECTDDFLPNAFYPYKVTVVSLSYIFPIL